MLSGYLFRNFFLFYRNERENRSSILILNIHIIVTLRNPFNAESMCVFLDRNYHIMSNQRDAHKFESKSKRVGLVDNRLEQSIVAT